MVRTWRLKHRTLLPRICVLSAALAILQDAISPSKIKMPCHGLALSTPGGIPYQELWQKCLAGRGSGYPSTGGMCIPSNSGFVSHAIRDKKMCEELSKNASLPFIESMLFNTWRAASMKTRPAWEETAEKAIQKFGYPMVLKPIRGSGGMKVHLVRTKEEFFAASKDLSSDTGFLLSPFISSSAEVRVIVGSKVTDRAGGLKVEPLVLGVYEKTLPKVTGDGTSTISSLIDAMKLPQNLEHLRKEFKDYVGSQGMLEEVPGKGTQVDVNWKFNQKQGSVASRVEEVDPAIAAIVALALEAARVMTLAFGSVDILITDEGPKILEMNEFVVTDLMDLHESKAIEIIQDQLEVADKLRKEYYRIAGNLARTADREQDSGNIEPEIKKERTYEQRTANQINIIKELANKYNFTYISRSFGFVQILVDPEGIRMHRSLNHHGSLNSVAAADVTSNKVLTADMLAEAGVPHVPHIELHFEENVDAAFAQVRGFQEKDAESRVVIKGRSGSSGKGCYLCKTKREVDKAVFQPNMNPCVSPYMEAVKEFRAFVLGGEVVSVYAKELPTVVGDGNKTVAELLREKGDNEIQFSRFVDKLQKELTNEIESYIPEKGEAYPLTWKFNMKYGCTASQVPLGQELEVEELAASASKALGASGAVDILQLANGSFTVMEMNSNPGIDELIKQMPSNAYEWLELRLLIDREIRKMWN